MNTEKILSVEEVADRIDRTPSMVQKLFNGSNPMQSFRVGKQICTFENKVEDYLKNSTKSYSQLKKMLKESAEKDVSQSQVDNLAFLMQKIYAYSQNYKSRNLDLAVKYITDEIKHLEGCVAANVGGVK
jgi:hypothetical protein